MNLVLKKLLLAVFLFAFTTQIFAVDKHNTYQWNKKNVIQNNGKIERSPWFEWWYYKIVLPKDNKAFFFVYGIVNPWDNENTLKGTRSSVSFGDFNDYVQVENRLAVQDFYAKYDIPYVEINDAGNIATATDKKLEGQIKKSTGEKYSWNINVEKKWAFDPTTWVTGKGITNIEWYPAQASATCSGKIESNGKFYEFENAPCYQDRNWGYSFPDWWAWIVSNSFENSPGTALAIGGGRPKFIAGTELIESVAIGFHYKGQEYTWRPHDLDKIKIDINFGKWMVTGSNRHYDIEINAFAPRSKFMDLQFTTPQGQVFHDYEALLGDVIVRFYKKTTLGKRILVDTLISHHAGIEYGSAKEFPLDEIFGQQKTLFQH